MLHRWSRRQVVQGAGAVSLGLLAGCGQLPGQTQGPTRVPRIGYLSVDADGPFTDGFRQGLRDVGYVEGQTIIVEYRFADRRLDRLPDLAAELAQLPVELIVAAPVPAASAARQAAPTLPIVIAGGDPIGSGLITSLARPSGNITGVTSGGIEMTAKWFELLKETVPEITRVAVLSDPQAPITEPSLREAERAAGTLQVHLHPLSARGPEEVESAFSTMSSESVDGLVVLPGGTMSSHRLRIGDLATRNHLPSIALWRDFVDRGGLLAYGSNNVDRQRRAAYYVDRILKGTKPADLPVEQPMRFDLVINLKTAQTLRLTIPPHVLLQATELIQ